MNLISSHIHTNLLYLIISVYGSLFVDDLIVVVFTVVVVVVVVVVVSAGC